MKQSLCATAKREKSRRRGTLPCGKLPENKESAPEGAPKAPQNVKTPRRVCARRRKWSLNHFCRRHVCQQKSFSARKRASVSECAAASRCPLKQTPQRSGVCLKLRKEDRPRPVGVDPPRRKVWDLPGCCAGQPEVGETAFLLKAQLPRHYDISAIIPFCQGLI